MCTFLEMWDSVISGIPLFLLWNYTTVMEFHYFYYGISFFITIMEFLNANVKVIMKHNSL